MLYIKVAYETNSYRWTRHRPLLPVFGGVFIIVAVLIARFNSPTGDDFYFEGSYGRSNRNMASTLNGMLFWTIAFMAWWAWDDIVIIYHRH